MGLNVEWSSYRTLALPSFTSVTEFAAFDLATTELNLLRGIPLYYPLLLYLGFKHMAILIKDLLCLVLFLV